MAEPTGGQPPPVTQNTTNTLTPQPTFLHTEKSMPNTQNQTYANLFKPSIMDTATVEIPSKKITYINGEPFIAWKSNEIQQMTVKEKLQYAVIGKFSYDNIDIKELKKVIPIQYGIKGVPIIGLLDERHILIQLNFLEDYVRMMSTPAYYLKVHDMYCQMRPLIWDPWFNPKKETSRAVAWISFPELPPNFFAKEAVFSMATAVGKPLTVDLATANKTRPSCAKIKVEVDLLATLPKRINIAEEDESGILKSKWVRINYDYLPKYFKHCKLQGHKEKECRVLNPELAKQFREEVRKENAEVGSTETQNK
ncbi:uncharacterized protein LOC132607962 [Lycium barbarum]|uniref:uncharacterized protein LOC132607962 n=1 Tax=Lycium barbarum TaxID=112863 RepID=UPI00293EFE40|nr:uncharacterized protein LOC132607962 [Lycium barbarum]